MMGTLLACYATHGLNTVHITIVPETNANVSKVPAIGKHRTSQRLHMMIWHLLSNISTPTMEMNLPETKIVSLVHPPMQFGEFKKNFQFIYVFETADS
jgi:hypothetical protein